MGCDITPVITRLLSRRFNSRSPSGLRQKGGDVVSFVLEFQFTQPKWAATNDTVVPSTSWWFQFTQPKRAATPAQFWREQTNKFQFTQPKRAATSKKLAKSRMLVCFNSRSPSGLRPIVNDGTIGELQVSIHAAQAGCDAQVLTTTDAGRRFQFTQPKRAATFFNVGL